MLTLVISDIHANLTALEAVLADVNEYEQVWCLGDIVGYGPDPNQCIERLKELPNLTCVVGNHDAAALGMIEIEAFNFDARRSLRWLEGQLEPQNRKFLEVLLAKVVLDGVTLVHGSPRNPVWEYVMDPHVARDNFSAFESEICLVGHSHIPLMFTLNPEGECNASYLEAGHHFKPKTRAIINPGSVGQPRDRDPRASYLVYDTFSHIWENHRVAYDVQSVQERILDARLPIKHAYRLKDGI